MNMENDLLRQYAQTFGYKVLDQGEPKNLSYIKRTCSGFIVIESCASDRYVSFYYNEKNKVFKKSDLILSLIDRTPVA